MRLIGNLLWLLCGGFAICIEYLIASVILMLTIIGIPFGMQTLKLAAVALFPFDREITENDTPTGCLSLFMNVLWIFCGGIWICLTHLFFGVILCVTIIGFPFGMQHFKLSLLALAPFGKEIR